MTSFLDHNSYYNEDSIENICKFYSNDYTKYNELYNSFFFKISLVNVKYYRRLYYAMDYLRNNNNDKYYNYGKNKNNKEFESTIINLSFNNFICMINIFVFYLVSIFFLYNKSNVANYDVCTISDYAILLTNLNNIYGLFKNNLEDIGKEEFANRNKKIKKIKYNDKLGFKPDENKSQIELFKKFLEKKYFKKMIVNLHNISI